MNFIIITAHALGRRIAPYGYPTETPALMALARRGICFRNAFALSGHPSPARAALYTGLAPHVSGMVGPAQRGFTLAPDAPHLAAVLRENGYHTAIAGYQGEEREGREAALGYDDVLVKSFRGSDVLRDSASATAAAQFISTYEGEKPFLLSIGYTLARRDFPHVPANAETGYLMLPPGLPDTLAMRKDYAGFLLALHELDRCVGEVVDALDASAHAENTVIVFTTDGGPSYPRSRYHLNEQSLGVSLIITFAGNPYAGMVTEALVCHADIYPTLLAIAEIAPDPRCYGVSLIPILRGERGAVRDEVVSENNWHFAYEPCRSLRMARYRLTRFYDYDTGFVLPNMDKSPAKALWMERGYAQRARPREALYDLDWDESERDNLLGVNAFADVYKTMSLRLDKHMKRSDDPLYARIPRPDGYKADARYGLHADSGSYEA